MRVKLKFFNLILTVFIISLLFEIKEKEEPPPSGLGSPPLLRYIIKLSSNSMPNNKLRIYL